MNDIYLLLGSNLGDRMKILSAAMDAIDKQVGKVQQCSSYYETEAWGVEDQDAFLNQVIHIRSTLSAQQILDTVQKIELDLGRIRLVKWGARTIDIDILYYNEDIIDSPRLSVPHPFIAQRKFTLAPLVELAPSFIHPIYKKTNSELLAICADPLSIKKII